MTEILFTQARKYPHPVRGVHLLFLATLLLMACGGDEFQDLQDFVKDSGADLRGQVDPAPEIKAYEPFPYVRLQSK